ncbi:MAG TPA: LytTR family transcriptional regulator [Ruminococcaceae bacterium]|jgi:DNA-binding LytR/AlgR family response regulator|nr:LytTR family transcriptional regulator [Oscillospiraceae bacterium]
MQIEIKIDADCKEPKVIVLTDKITDEISELLKRLSEETPQMLVGFRGNTLEILEQANIFRIYAQAGKVIATTSKGNYLLRLRLYELEDRLGKSSFVRISNSEIINLKKVKAFDLSFAGTICVSLSNGTVTYVSRRYVSKIKKVLGI